VRKLDKKRESVNGLNGKSYTCSGLFPLQRKEWLAPFALKLFLSHLLQGDRMGQTSE